MTHKLVIVESPAKARTIAGYLGRDYVVESSIGHIRDLPQGAADTPAKIKDKPWGRMAVDVDNGFEPYYVVPQDDLAEEAFIVLREALRAKKKVALGQLSVRGRELLVSLNPCGKGIVMETLRYEDEVRAAHGYFKDIPSARPAKEMLDLAGALIDQKSAKFDAGEFRDRYVDALKKLVAKKAKAKGKRILEDVEEPAARGKSNVIDLMAALKGSVGKKAAPAEAKPSPRKRA